MGADLLHGLSSSVAGGQEELCHGPDSDVYHKNAIDGPFKRKKFVPSQRVESS